MTTPRLLIAGLSGGGGKTLLSIGMLAAWRRSGRAVAAFKKGPDYIDAAWLTRAARQPCRNLDVFLMPRETILGSFAAATSRADVALIEGNRGLYDGADARGTCSTAELAKLLQTPVVLVVDCTKSTRTVAALVLGCQRLDPEVPIRGVVLNRVAGGRHENVVRHAIEDACQIPVLGAVPRLAPHPFPERHLGLVPPQEHTRLDDAVDHAARIVEQYLDLEALLAVARTAPPLRAVPPPSPDRPARSVARVGVFRDAAFQFYYPENLEALVRTGAHLVEISPLADGDLPDVDALYIGGGFPETAAGALSDNRPFRAAVRDAVSAGLPVYAECGGAVYLGAQLVIEGRTYPMVGALPAAFGFAERPQGHGYAQLETVGPNPFFDIGQTIAGHEFHYTFLENVTADTVSFAFRVRRGYGCDGHADGLCHRNVLASYTHVHALGTPAWAPGILRAAQRFQAADVHAAGVRG